MKFKRLGDYIQLVDNRNKDSKVNFLQGVSTRKVLIDSVANTEGVSFHNYKILEKGQFVYVADTSRRGEKIAIALNDKETCIVSSIYTVFEIKDTTKLLPEFIFIWFNRTEFDRYARYNSWGSARETFSWEDLCDVKLPIPDDIEEQRKYVDLYKGLITNQKCYEESLNDLQLICDAYIERLIKIEEPKRLGVFIKESNERNEELKFSFVRGVAIKKELIETKANMEGVSLNKYKVVRYNYFAFNPNTSRNGDKIAIALNQNKECLVSSIYKVFSVINTKLLLPEFLFLFFKRSEFDRYCRFHSYGSAM
jgi:type I restriction enzyme S subunit